MKTALRVLKFAVAAGALAWLVSTGKLDFALLFSGVHWQLHILGILISLSSMLLQTIRWQLLLRMQHIDLALSKAIMVKFIGQFFTLFLPGVIGGELVRCYYVVRETADEKIAAVSTVLFDQMAGLYAVCMLGTAAFVYLLISDAPVHPFALHLGMVNLAIFLGITLSLFILGTKKMAGGMTALLPEPLRLATQRLLDRYRREPLGLFYAFVLSILAALPAFGAYALAARIAQAPLDFYQILLVCPLIYLANTLPISPAGIGVGETVAFLLFGQFDVQTGALIVMIVRLWMMVIRIPGAVMYVLYRPKNKQ